MKQMGEEAWAEEALQCKTKDQMVTLLRAFTANIKIQESKFERISRIVKTILAEEAQYPPACGKFTPNPGARTFCDDCGQPAREHSNPKQWMEALWSAASKLESQVCRQPTLPESYKDIVHKAFESLHELEIYLVESGQIAGAPAAPAQPISYEGRKFERTGEVRPPRRLEWFLSISSIPTCSCQDFDNPEAAREILREIPKDAEALAKKITEVLVKFMVNPQFHPELFEKEVLAVLRAVPLAPASPRCPRCGSEVFNVVMSVAYCQRADCQHEGPTAEFFSSPAPASPQDLAGRIAEAVNLAYVTRQSVTTKELADIIEQELKRP